MRFFSSAAAAACGLACLASIAMGQTDTAAAARPKPGRIVGVFDAQTSSPLEGAEITDLIGGGSARTLKAGLFGMAAFQSQHDSSVIRVRKVGYADTTVLVMVGAKDTVPMQIFLRPVVALPEVAINAKETDRVPFYLRDFQQRVQDGQKFGGKAFTPADVRKLDGRRLAALLREKGIGIRTAHCRQVGLVVNGVGYHPIDVTPGSAGIPDEFVDQYEAFFYYPAGRVPAEFQKPTIGGDCGVLVMYPRAR
jgi:hypothetical protein